MRARVLWTVLLLALAALPLASSRAAQPAGAPPAARTIAAPEETREVVAEGRAAIGAGGIPGAREAAVAQALRAAVEKTLGVYVSARTLTHNYQLLSDEVATRAAGYATLREIVREQTVAGEVRVTVRALVSLQPLAKRLRELKLTRAWRVRVEVEGDAPLPAAVALLERALADAGFVVVADGADDAADLLVQVSPSFERVARIPVETAIGSMNLHSVRAEIVVRAVQAQTREVVAAFSGSDVLAHVDESVARATATDRVLGVLSKRLADALMVLPARESQPVTLVVSKMPGIARVGAMQDALRSLPGVRAVTRRSWDSAVATWELDVATDALPLLARALEEDPNLRPFRLTVSSETRARITATVRPAPEREGRGGG